MPVKSSSAPDTVIAARLGTLQRRTMRSRWVTFDCFGTLVDWHSGFAAILRPITGERTAELLRAYHAFERQIEAERPSRLYADVLAAALLLAAQKIGLPLSESQANSLPQAWGSLPIFPDVEPELAALRKAGCKLGVLTNCDEALFEQTRLSFGESFDAVVTAERVQDYKPSLSHFRFFSRTSSVDHVDWVHVACSWFHDIAPAREFGIRRIWLDRDRTGEDAAAASLRLTSAKGLADAIAQIHTG
jgi:2-haloacid dehalogenase